MSSYQVGQEVRLVPTQGGHQKERQGVVSSVTPTQVGVRREGVAYEVRYRASDGMAVKQLDRAFPCYVLRPAGESQS